MEKPPILLIHGACCNGESWGDFAEQLRMRGFEVHTPTLRHHGVFQTEAVWKEKAREVARVSLRDYLSDMEEIFDEISVPPIIIGHSMGGLIAQLLATRRKNQGLVLLASVPASGIFIFYLTQMRFWMPYFWVALFKKPMMPAPPKKWQNFICNAQTETTRKEMHSTLCADSGKVYFETCLWFLDRKRAAYVNYEAVQCPVLVVSGSQDKCTSSKISRSIASKYGDKATYARIEGADHMLMIGSYLQETLHVFDEWAKSHFG